MLPIQSYDILIFNTCCSVVFCICFNHEILTIDGPFLKGGHLNFCCQFLESNSGAVNKFHSQIYVWNRIWILNLQLKLKGVYFCDGNKILECISLKKSKFCNMFLWLKQNQYLFLNNRFRVLFTYFESKIWFQSQKKTTIIWCQSQHQTPQFSYNHKIWLKHFQWKWQWLLFKVPQWVIKC